MNQSNSFRIFDGLNNLVSKLLLGALLLFPVMAQAQIPVQQGGTVNIDQAGGTINGGGRSGYLVLGGTLNISNTTLTNFNTVGGDGSGGGAGMGGALFIGNNSTVTLNNVNFIRNFAQGGRGGIGSSGGAMNNIQNLLSPANGYNGQDGNQLEVTLLSFIDGDGVGGKPGTDGGPGLSSGSSVTFTDYSGQTFTQVSEPPSNGFGGKGGNGSNGSAALNINPLLLATIAYNTYVVSDDTTKLATASKNLADATAAAGEEDALAAEEDTKAADGDVEAAGFDALDIAAAIPAEGIGGGIPGPVVTEDPGLIAGETVVSVAADIEAADEDAEAVTEDTKAATADEKVTTAQEQVDTATEELAKANEELDTSVTELATWTAQEIAGIVGNGGDGAQAGAGGNGAPYYGGGAGGNGGNGGASAGVGITLDGNGGNAGNGGNGGFGAGGGAAGNAGTGAAVGGQSPGGTGGFGGGSGANGSGQGGFVGSGAGGDAMGGAIFVQAGSTLILHGNITFDGNALIGGQGEAASAGVLPGAAGISVGTDLFMMTGSNVVLDPGLGNTITFDGNPYGMSIADDSLPSILSAGGTTSIPPGSGANITIASGLVVFGGNNLYSGTTFLKGGVLEAQDTQGIYFGSHINFNGGTLESNGSFIRYVGTRNTDVDWTGSGGFAALGGNLTVTLGNGFQQTEQWGSNNFVPFGSSLLFGAYNSDNSTVFFENNIDLGGQADTILVTDNGQFTDPAQIDGNISDGSLVVNDATHDGILILNGTNTYTGSTTVLNGTLQLSPNGTLASTSTITVDGSNTTFDLGANHTNQTFAAVTLSNGASITGTGTSSITSTTDYQLENGTVTAILAGTVGLQKTTTSLVTLSGNNTYTGDTVITAGTLAESSTGYISDSSNLTVNGSTAQFDLGGNHSDQVANVTLENGGLISGTGNSTLSSNVGFQVLNGTVTAILGGNGGLNKTTSDIVYLDNINTYSGNTNVFAGTLTLNSTGQLSNASNLTINGTAAYFDLGANNSSPAANVTLVNGFINGTGNSTLSSSVGFQVHNGTVNAILGGTAGLNKTTSGTVYLNGNNTYTGNTTILAGTLTENSTGYLSDNSNLTINGTAVPAIVSGATVSLVTPDTVSTSLATFDLGANHSDTVANVTLVNGYINGTGTSTLTSTVGFQVMNGTANAILGGAGIPLNKTTNGTVILNNSNTYTGDTSVYAGTLSETSTGFIADTSNLTINATTGISANFDLGSNHSDTVANVTLVSGVINGTGNSTLTSTVGYQVQNGTVNAILGGAGIPLNKTNTNGTVFLNGNNTYTGDTNVYAGTLTENSTGFIADTSNLTVNGTTAYFDLGANHSDTVANVTLLNGFINGTGNSTLTSTIGYQVQNGTVNAILGGVGIPLNKTNSNGTVFLNSNNTYTGDTNVYAGTLTENSTGFIADTSNLTVNGTTAYFDLGANHSDTVANVTLINGFINGTGTATLTSTIGYQVQNGTVNAILGGNVGLNKTTNGTVYLNSNNTYSGNTTITAGTLTENSTGYINDNSVLIVIGPNSTFDLGGNHSDTVGEVILSGNGNITGTGTSALTSSNTTSGFELMNGTVTAILAGNNVPLIKSTSGLATLSGNNTYTGNTTILAGTLAESATGFIADTSNLTIDGSGNFAQLDLGANHSDLVANVTLVNGTINGTGNSTLSSNIGFQVMNGTVNAMLGGTGPLNKTTGGTVYLNGNNTYTGDTNVFAGTLTLNSTGQLSSSSNLTVNGTTAIFDLGANNTSPAANVTLVNGLINGTGTSTLSSNVGFQVMNGTVNAALGGTGPLNKTTGGTVYLNGNNTYTGDTSVFAGTLTLNSTGQLSGLSNLTVNGTTAEFDLGANNTSSAANVTLVCGLINGTGTSTLSSNVGFQVISGNVNAQLGGTGPLNKTNSNTTVYLNGSNNTYTGATTVSAGTLVINGALSTNNTVNVSSGAQLSINKNISIGTLNSNGLTTGTSILTANTFNLNDGAVVNQTLGLGNIVSNGNVTINATILSANINILTGNMNVQQGNLTSSAAVLDIALGANIVLNGGNNTISQLNGSGMVISNNFTLNVLNGGNFTGTVGGSGNTGGTLTLNSTSSTASSGANITNNSTVNVNGNTSFGNTTNITSGNLNVNGTVTSGNIIVSSGGTLGGNGTVTGNVTVSGGTLAASDPSNLTINGPVNLSSGNMNVQIYGTGGPGVNPNGNDNYIINGLVTINPVGTTLVIQENTTVGNTFTNVAAGQSFQFITTSPGNISGHFGSIINPFGNLVAVDLSSGHILGTNIPVGVSANIDSAFPTATANQLAMINQTVLASDTGSVQLDGGDLIQQLLTNPAATTQVFNQASPEAYAGLADYALRSARSYLDTALTLDPVANFGKYEVFAGYNYYNAATDSSQNQADYKLGSNGGLLGFRTQVASKVSLGLFAGFDTGTVKSTYLNTSDTGFVGGVFGTVDPLDSHRLLGTASFTYGGYSTHGTRSTFSGTSSFSGVGSNVYQGDLRVQYVAIQQPKYAITPEIDVAYSHSKVDAITEANIVDPLQALQVNSISTPSLRTEGAINGVYNLTTQVGLTGRFGVSHDFEHTYRDVTANVVGEPTEFTVRAPGLGSTDYDVGVGIFYNPIAHLRLQVNYTAGFSTQAKMSNALSVGGSYSW